jgi:DNA repair protein RecN (Recombination protein N)
MSVEKRAGGGRTRVSVSVLDKGERVRELARMLGGAEGSATASAHAEELVRQGELHG